MISAKTPGERGRYGRKRERSAAGWPGARRIGGTLGRLRDEGWERRPGT